MKTVILIALLTALTIGNAYAPPVEGESYIVRSTYQHDLKIQPYTDPKRCEVTRKNLLKELPELDGYEKIVSCVKVGR